MKLLEKITNLFMDEVDDDEEVELEEEEKEEYKEPPKKVLPKIMREAIEKEEKIEELPEMKITTPTRDIMREEKIVQPVQVSEPARKFNFPIDFEEEVKKAEVREEIPKRRTTDSIDILTKKNSVNHNASVLNNQIEQTRKINELYPKKESNIKPKFRASPVISPVYGILDKNYTKEEVREKNDDSNIMKRPSKKVDFETVRKKAFGNLADEIKDNLQCENCELYKEVKKISALKEDDLLYDMTVEAEKEVTIKKAYENYEEFGVAYEPEKRVVKKENDDSLTEMIKNINNNSYEDVIKEDIIINNNDDTNKEEEISYHKMENKIDDDVNTYIEDTKSEDIPSRQNKKEEKVDEDFFELIDSMYKERIDE